LFDQKKHPNKSQKNLLVRFTYVVFMDVLLGDFFWVAGMIAKKVMDRYSLEHFTLPATVYPLVI